VAHPTVNGLSRNDADLRGYRINLQLTAQLYYTANLTKAWLGSAGSYTLPDLSASGLLGYTAPTSGSGSFRVSAILSSKPLFALDPNNPSTFSTFQPGDYIREAEVDTNSYTVGGGNLTLP